MIGIGLCFFNLAFLPFAHLVGILLGIIGLAKLNSSGDNYGTALLLNTIAIIFGLILALIGLLLW